MSDKIIQNKDFGFIDESYQFKLFHLLLTNQKLGIKYIEYLDAAYFTKVQYKKLFNIIKNFLSKFGYLPSIKKVFNSSNIIESIKSSSSTSEKDVEELIECIKLVYVYEAKINDQEFSNDTEFVIDTLKRFIKQQESIKLGTTIFESVENGVFDSEDTQAKIFDIQTKIEKLDLEDDQGQDVFDNIDEVLSTDYRHPIPTGDPELDKIMNGGLGEGEMAFILAPLGTGKTTLLSLFANHAQKEGKNVLYLFFEDKYKEIKRKHYSIWSGVKQSEFANNTDKIREAVERVKNDDSYGILKILKLKSENITIPKIKKFIIEYQKRNNIKFDIIFLDYLDCVESHIKHKNELKEELYVIKAFEAMLDELAIPGWGAIQGNRESISAEIVNTNQMGGSIKKAQKTHFLMSVNRPFELKIRNQANVVILKSRIGHDGIICKESDLDNDNIRFKLNTSSVDSTEIDDFISSKSFSNDDISAAKSLLDK